MIESEGVMGTTKFVASWSEVCVARRTPKLVSGFLSEGSLIGNCALKFAGSANSNGWVVIRIVAWYTQLVSEYSSKS